MMNLVDGNLSHPDFLLVQREQDEKTGRYKDISKEQILDLIGKAAFAPVMSDTKVCIIEDADRMTLVAANSFLKMLEEPPTGWVIILLASDESKLLTTVMSRVVCLRFQPVPVEQVQKLLETKSVAAPQAAALARISEGSIGTALNLAEQNVFELRQQALAFLEALPLRTPMNYLAERVWQQKNFERPQALLLTKLWQLLLRDLLMCQLHLENKIYNCDLTAQLTTLANGWRTQNIKLALTDVQEAYAALENSVGVRLALEAMALKIDQAYKE